MRQSTLANIVLAGAATAQQFSDLENSVSYWADQMASGVNSWSSELGIYSAIPLLTSFSSLSSAVMALSQAAGSITDQDVDPNSTNNVNAAVVRSLQAIIAKYKDFKDQNIDASSKTDIEILQGPAAYIASAINSVVTDCSKQNALSAGLVTYTSAFAAAESVYGVTDPPTFPTPSACTTTSPLAVSSNPSSSPGSASSSSTSPSSSLPSSTASASSAQSQSQSGTAPGSGTINSQSQSKTISAASSSGTIFSSNINPSNSSSSTQASSSPSSKVPSSAGGGATTVTTIVTAFTTVCTQSTTFSTNGKTYTATVGQTITVTNCPCTITSVPPPPPPISPPSSSNPGHPGGPSVVANNADLGRVGFSVGFCGLLAMML